MGGQVWERCRQIAHDSDGAHFHPSAWPAFLAGRYRFFTGSVLFEFGHGLHFTRFSHAISTSASTLSAPALVAELRRTSRAPHTAQPALRVVVRVRNVGALESSSRVLLFVRPPRGRGVPQLQLRSFAALPTLRPGEEREVGFELDAHDFAVANEDGNMVALAGEWRVSAGAAWSSVLVHD